MKPRGRGRERFAAFGGRFAGAGRELTSLGGEEQIEGSGSPDFVSRVLPSSASLDPTTSPNALNSRQSKQKTGPSIQASADPSEDFKSSRMGTDTNRHQTRAIDCESIQNHSRIDNCPFADVQQSRSCSCDSCVYGLCT